MFDELNKAIEEYRAKWAKVLGAAANKELFQELKPTAVGWKVANGAEFDRLLAEWREECGQVHMNWMNGRWIATLILRDGQESAWGLRVIKLMQRRPDSSDALGLDHVDFYNPRVAAAKEQLLTGEPALKVTNEENGACKWISIWFAGTEAKLRPNTTLDVCATEPLTAAQKITS
jgi:hypothetical protein